MNYSLEIDNKRNVKQQQLQCSRRLYYKNVDGCESVCFFFHSPWSSLAMYRCTRTDIWVREYVCGDDRCCMYNVISSLLYDSMLLVFFCASSFLAVISRLFKYAFSSVLLIIVQLSMEKSVWTRKVFQNKAPNIFSVNTKKKIHWKIYGPNCAPVESQFKNNGNV